MDEKGGNFVAACRSLPIDRLGSGSLRRDPESFCINIVVAKAVPSLKFMQTRVQMFSQPAYPSILLRHPQILLHFLWKHSRAAASDDYLCMQSITRCFVEYDLDANNYCDEGCAGRRAAGQKSIE